MFRSRMFKFVAIVGVLAGALASTNSVEAGGLRHRCCAMVCRPVPCPVVVVHPVRVIAVPMAVSSQVCVLPAPVSPRVVVKKYKITKIRYKVPKRKCAPVICPPVICPPVCAPVICAPVICCPAPIICPPICIPTRCCPIRSCR